MTFGVMPPYAEFATAVGGGTYPIEVHAGSEDGRVMRRLRVKPAGYGDHGRLRYELTAKQLYSAVRKLGNAGDEESMSLASAVMSTLGYEWI